MTLATDDFLRRIRAYVSALALLQRSQADSVGYAEFRRKLEKCVRLVVDTAAALLREALGAAALPEADLLRGAQERGWLSAEEAARWAGYFAGMLPEAGSAYGEETLVRLRALALDARSLEANLRSA